MTGASASSRRSDTDRRKALIAEARRLFVKLPYDQVTTTAIAENAGVAYGLIAHHFGNKRGIHRAVLDDIAAEIGAVQQPAEFADLTPSDQLRGGIRRHVEHVDSYADSFVAFVRADLGADPEQRGALDELRWMGAQRILAALAVYDPVPAVLRTAMRGWIGSLDEMMIDRITHQDVSVDAVVELAFGALTATLRAVRRLEPSIGISEKILDALETQIELDPSSSKRRQRRRSTR